MSKTLWTFGCSFTESLKSMERRDKETSPNNSFTQYKKFLGGELPPSWPDILSNKLNYNLENKGFGGSSNYSIFHTFIKNIDKIKKDDLIIFQWSSILRFRLIEENKFIDILPNEHHVIGFSKITLDEFLVNRDNNLWVSEIEDYTKILINYCKLKNIQILFWTHDSKILTYFDRKLYNKYFITKEYLGIKEHPMNYVFEFTKDVLKKNAVIKDETNDKIIDAHLGKYGHEVMADMFYDVLQKIKK
jgi:hypothetical protein